MNTEVKNFWNSLSNEQRANLLCQHDYWDGFVTYSCEYLPDSLIQILNREVKKNEPI